MAGNFDDEIRQAMQPPDNVAEAAHGFIGPGQARVLPDTMYDTPPAYEVYVGDEKSQLIPSQQEKAWWDQDRLLQAQGAPKEVMDWHNERFPALQAPTRWEQESAQAGNDAKTIAQAIMRYRGRT